MPLYPLFALYVVLCFIVFGKASYEVFELWRGNPLERMRQDPFDAVLAFVSLLVFSSIWPITLVVSIANEGANWYARRRRTDDRMAELEYFRICTRVASGCSLGATDAEVLSAIKKTMRGDVS